MSSQSQPYSETFLTGLSDGSVSSARVVLPMAVELAKPRSVVDVGCGLGAWAAVAMELGIHDVIAVDGDYVPRGKLLVPQERFSPRDLTHPLALGRRFDLVVCMEVAEHLPETSAETLIESLTQLAPAVLFSAAIPGQGGLHHVNEQWPEYWAKRFAARGFATLDCIRRRVWKDERVEWWYAQNTFLYAHSSWLESRPELKAFTDPTPLDLVHPLLYQHKSALQHAGLRLLMSKLPGAAKRSIQERVHRLFAKES